MHYFILTYQVYVDSVFIAGGKFGRATLVPNVCDKPVLEWLVQYYTRVLTMPSKLTIEIIKTEKVYQSVYEHEAINFIMFK